MSKKSLHVHWSGEGNNKEENKNGGPPNQNGILKNTSVWTGGGKPQENGLIVPERVAPLRHVVTKKRSQDSAEPPDNKRARQEAPVVRQSKQKQMAPLPPNMAYRSYNQPPPKQFNQPPTSLRRVPGGGQPHPSQYVYMQQPGGSTRRYPSAYPTTRPHSAHMHVRNVRTLPPSGYRLATQPFEVMRMDDQVPHARQGRYRPKVIQEHFSPHTIRDAEFLNKRGENPAPEKRNPALEKRKLEQIYTWEQRDWDKSKVVHEKQNEGAPIFRSKVTIRRQPSPSPIHPSSAADVEPRHVASVSLPSTYTRYKDGGDYVIVDYLVENLGPKMLQMKLADHHGGNNHVGLTNGQSAGPVINHGRPASAFFSRKMDMGEHTWTPATRASEPGAGILDVQKLQERQSEVSQAQLQQTQSDMLPVS